MSDDQSPLLGAQKAASDLKAKLFQSCSCLTCCCACCCCVVSIPIIILLGLFLLPSVTCFIPMGTNGLPLGYIPSMLELDARWWGGDVCGAHVWESIYGWEAVSRLGAELPAKQWSGQWWRGNELGYIINDPIFWSKAGIWPQTNVIGLPASQHAAMRPILVDAFKVSDRHEVQSFVRASVRDFFAQRREAGELRVQADILAWVHQVLFKTTFGEEISFESAQEFVAVQQKEVQMGTVSQALPAIIKGMVVSGEVESVAAKVAEYGRLAEARYGDRLAGKDCSPSPDCTVQLASAIWDALYSAGGLSVPQVISSGLGVLYSTSWTNPSPNFTIPEGQEAEFFWECARFFPPVVGFPVWATRPVCDGSDAQATAALNHTNGETEACEKLPEGWFSSYPPVNQYQGGSRIVMNLPSGQLDKEKWGPRAKEFHLFSLGEYEENSVGFAEMAVDNDVANGDMNRNCPGRELALIIGTVFFEEFDQSAWEPSGTDIRLLQAAGPNTVTAFTLKPKAPAS